MHLDQSALLVGLIRKSMRVMLGKVGTLTSTGRTERSRSLLIRL